MVAEAVEVVSVWPGVVFEGVFLIHGQRGLAWFPRRRAQGWTIRFGTETLRPNLQVPPVRDGETSRFYEPHHVASRAEENFVDDVFGRRHLAVAVVPSKLGELQQVEDGWSAALAEDGFDAWAAFGPAGAPTCCHVPRVVEGRASAAIFATTRLTSWWIAAYGEWAW